MHIFHDYAKYKYNKAHQKIHNIIIKVKYYRMYLIRKGEKKTILLATCYCIQLPLTITYFINNPNITYIEIKPVVI